MPTHIQLKIFFAGLLIVLATLSIVTVPAQVMGAKKPAVAAGSSVSFLPVVTYDPGGQSLSVAIADVNGDGKPDLVVAKACGSSCAEGSTERAARARATARSSCRWSPTNLVGRLHISVAVADVNGDGKPDLVSGQLWAHRD